MADIFQGSQTMHRHGIPRKAPTRSSRSIFGPGNRRRWGLEEIVPPAPSFPVTTAHALHDLLRCETDAITGTLARGYKRHHQLPKPPKLLSKFSIRASTPSPRKSHYSGGSRATKAFGKSLVAKSPSTMLGGSMIFPGSQSRGSQAYGSMSMRSPRGSHLFQLKGLKTQGTRAKIVEELEHYRLNSQARMQLKQRSESYLVEKHHERLLSKQGL